MSIERLNLKEEREAAETARLKQLREKMISLGLGETACLSCKNYEQLKPEDKITHVCILDRERR